MKSYEDELNDAVRKALQDSFENFERKPHASVDEKIYKALLDKPSRMRPLVLLSAVALLLLVGFGVLKINERRASSRPVALSRPIEHARNEAKSNATGQHGKLANADRLSHIENNSEESQFPHVENNSKVSRSSHTESNSQVSRANPVVGKPVETSNPAKLVNAQDKQPELTREKAPKTANQVFPAEKTSFPAANIAPELSVQEPVSAIAGLYPIPAGDLAPLPIALVLPEITSVVAQDDSAFQPIMPRSVKEKLDFPKYQPSEKKSFAWLFNLTATNTFQSVYLLPNAESRILKVSFPVSTANMGFNLGAGFQTMGFQILLNYSHMSWKAEYVYAINEYKADEQAAKRYVFERLGKAETVTSKMDIAGIRLKKQLDFKSQRLGRFFTQVGLSYSHQLQSGSQNFLAGAISAGRIITVNKTTDLMVGPYFEYNFKKVSTAEYNIKVRPNQVGLSVGLRINRQGI